MLGCGINMIWCHFYSCLLSNWFFSEKFTNCSNSFNFEAKINFNTSRQNELKWRKTCTGLKFDLMHFNGPQTKFIRVSLYKHPVGLVYCYDHNYCILIVCTLHITVVWHDGNNSAPRHFLPILNSFSPSGVPRTVPAEDRKPMLHIRPDDKLSQVGISKLKIAIRPACNS